MTANYTQGEWKINPMNEQVIMASNKNIAVMVGELGENEEWQANARLIAAAPAMYQALDETTILLELLFSLITDPIFNKAALVEMIGKNRQALAAVEGGNENPARKL